MIVYAIRLKGTEQYLSKDGVSTNNYRVFTKIQSARMALKTEDNDRDDPSKIARPLEIVAFELVEINLQEKMKELLHQSATWKPTEEEMEHHRKEHVINEMLKADPNLPRSEANIRYDKAKQSGE